MYTKECNSKRPFKLSPLMFGIVFGSASFAFLPSAQAQSELTLYGSIDAGIGYTNNVKGGSLTQATTGKLGGNRWGLRGVEDLGGGLKALFVLENGFSAVNGTSTNGSREFGRSSWVGLSSRDYGMVSFGRQYDAMTGTVSNGFGSGYWNPATHIGDNDNLNQYFRLNNSVKYVSPVFSGLSFGGVYAFSNQSAASSPGGFANNSAWSGDIKYDHGPFSVAAGYLQLNHPDATSNTSGAVGGSTTSGDDYSGAFFNGIDNGVARQQIAAIGGTWQLGLTTFNLGYSHTTYNYNDGAARKLSNIDAGVRYRVTTPLLLIADYVYTDGRATGLPGARGELRPRWHQITLAADYNLSKRTDVYLTGTYQKAVGDGSTLVNGSYRNIASISQGGNTSGSSSELSVGVGIRHKF